MPETTREAVAAFDTIDALDASVYKLETQGFDRAAFSLLATEKTVEQKLGHRYREVKDVEEDPRVPRQTFFSRVSRFEAEMLPAPALAAVGALIMVGVGSLMPILVAAGTGGLVGAMLGRVIEKNHATRIQEQLARGGLLLWVNVRNLHEEETALEVLRTHAAHDVHVHDIIV